MIKVFKIIRFLAFITILVILLNITSKVFTPKWQIGDNQGQTATIKGMYKLKKNSIDVLFLGDSSLYKSVSPIEIYEQTGIVSYNYSVSSARIYMFYYFIQDILKYQHPKVVMVDPLTLFYEEKEVEPERRKSFDYMKFSKTKLDMINDPVFENTLEEKISYIFPIFRYHSRYESFDMKELENTFKDDESVTRGYVLSKKLLPNKQGFLYMKPTGASINMKPYSKEYLEKFIKICKDKNIDLVFIGIPDKYAWNYEKNELFKKMVKDYDVKYLDLNNDSLGINWYEDSEDGGYHMNLLGAEKVTNKVAEYLIQNYDLPITTDETMKDKVIKYNMIKEKYKTILFEKIKNKRYDRKG